MFRDRPVAIYNPDKIIRNSAQCLVCNDILVSEFGHDFKTCTCGNLCVDGGKQYIRRLFRDRAKIKELNEYQEILDVS